MNKTDLLALLTITNGSSKALDRAVSDALDAPERDYSSSVDACLDLIHKRMPKAHWHVGRAEDGVSMYATLAHGRHREENTNVTIPLALLTVMVKSLTASGK